jgi:fimbrial protein pilin
MQKKKGFTLVELLVTICVISILSTVSVFGYYGYVHRNNLKLDELEVEQANKALEAYFVKHSNHLTSAKDVRDAIYETTKGNFDLDTFTLRSQEKDYHLFLQYRRK